MAERVPTETQEMRWLFEWARVQRLPPWLFPDEPGRRYAHFLFHIPNEGKRSKAAGGIAKAAGLQKGVPDLCFALPVGERPGLFIELKSTAKYRRTTPEQDEWIERLDGVGYGVAICRGWREAAEVLSEYTKQCTHAL